MCLSRPGETPLTRGRSPVKITGSCAELAVGFVHGSPWYRPIVRVGPLDYAWAARVAAAIATPGGPVSPRPG
jgi:hypothetical protein